MSIMTSDQSPALYLLWEGLRPIEELKSRLEEIKEFTEDHPKALKIALPYSNLKEMAEELEKAGFVPGLIALPQSKKSSFASQVSGKVAKEAGAKFTVISSDDFEEVKGELLASLDAGLEVLFCLPRNLEEPLIELLSGLNDEQVSKLRFVNNSTDADILPLDTLKEESLSWDKELVEQLKFLQGPKRLIKLPTILDNFNLLSWQEPIYGFVFFEASQKPSVALQYVKAIFSNLPKEAAFSKVVASPPLEAIEETLEETIFDDSNGNDRSDEEDKTRKAELLIDLDKTTELDLDEDKE